MLPPEHVEKCKEDAAKALQIIVEAISLNNLPNSAALTACINLTFHILERGGLSQEMLREFASFIQRALSDMGADYETGGKSSEDGP